MASTNLPLQLTSFIGRERELAEVSQLVSTSRLVTLSGAGGCGKTRLALQVANAVSDTFADGVWWVDLVPLQEPALLPQFVAQALGVRQESKQLSLDQLLNWVQPRQLLLILDNCEHLSVVCAHLAQSLLLQASHLHILATSREPLAVEGETIYAVLPLALPSIRGEGIGLPTTPAPIAFGRLSLDFSRDRQARLDPEVLIQYEAIHLFVERARASLPTFTLTAENAAASVEICCRLDGIPLALELASAHVHVLSLEQIAVRLDNRFALLTSGQRLTRVPHHQTLRAAIDWSYTLLTGEEQTLLRRLAVFAAGCTLDAAEAVCAGEGLEPARILDLLSSLVDKSLVVAETLARAQARYRLLETIRDYALEKLTESGEMPRLRDRHLDLFVFRAEEIAPKLRGQYQQLWLNWLEAENDNIRAALAWALERQRIDAGLRIANALVGFWETRAYVREGYTWFERLLTQADDSIPLAIRVNALTCSSFLASFVGDVPTATARGQQAAALCEAAGEDGKPLLPFALGGLATSAREAGDYQTAYTITERVIDLYRELGDRSALGMVLLIHANQATALHKYDRARALLDEGQALVQALGDVFRLAIGLNFLGDLERCEQNYGRAQTAYEQSLSYLQELGAIRDAARVLNSLAHTHLHQADVERAHTLFRESVASQQAQGNSQGVVECLIGFGALAAVSGLPAQATRLLAAAVALGGRSLFSQWPAEQIEYEQCLGEVQAQLTDQEFEAAQREGRALTIAQAIDYALSLPLAPAPSAPAPKDELGGLTEREREVVVLIALGKANREIAEELVLSKRTVEKHIANILSKLAVTSRAQIVQWTIENGLT